MRRDLGVGDGSTPRSTRSSYSGWSPSTGLMIAVVLLVVASAVFAFWASRHRGSSVPSSTGGAQALATIRPSGIPSTVSTRLANIMSLSPTQRKSAPAFSLINQSGDRVSLHSLAGKVVVLEFMDPHCTDICPIVSKEFIDAYRKLGSYANRVVFAAINVNQYALSVQDVAHFTSEQGLNSIPSWQFLTTNNLSSLKQLWASYGIQVQSRGPTADVIHSSIVYFISPHGTEQYLASPQVDHTAGGTAFLPLSQQEAWGQGIAAIAKSML